MMKFSHTLMAGLFATLISVPVASMAHDDFNDDHDDRVEQQTVQSPEYAKKRQQAIQILQKRGYQVKHIELDVDHGRSILDIDATKKGKKYDIEMEYPSLKVIKERLDRD